MPVPRTGDARKQSLLQGTPSELGRIRVRCNMRHCSKSVEVLVTHTGLLGVAVGKGLAKSFSECEMVVNAHGRKSYSPDPYMSTISSPRHTPPYRRVGEATTDRSDRRVPVSHSRYRFLPDAVSRSGRRTGRTSEIKEGGLKTETHSDLLFSGGGGIGTFDLRVMSPIRTVRWLRQHLSWSHCLPNPNLAFVAEGLAELDRRRDSSGRGFGIFLGCRPTLHTRLFTRTLRVRVTARPTTASPAESSDDVRDCAEWCIYAAGGVGGLSSTCECSRTPGRRVPGPGGACT